MNYGKFYFAKEEFATVLNNNLTGFGETESNAIKHHSIEQIEPDSEGSEKPHRMPKVKLYVARRNKRKISGSDLAPNTDN